MLFEYFCICLNPTIVAPSIPASTNMLTNPGVVFPAATPPTGVVLTPPDVPVSSGSSPPPRSTLPPVVAVSILTPDMMTLPVGHTAVRSADPEAKADGTVRFVLNDPFPAVVALPIIACVLALLKVKLTFPPAVVPQTPLAVKVPPIVGLVSVKLTVADGSTIELFIDTAPDGHATLIVTGPPPMLEGIVRVPLYAPSVPVVETVPMLVVPLVFVRLTPRLVPVANVPQDPERFNPCPKTGVLFTETLPTVWAETEAAAANRTTRDALAINFFIYSHPFLD
jgi:hypothetical protein